MGTSYTVSSYLIQQLYAHGVRHVFGIPGDYVLGFYRELDRSSLKIINTSDEQGAGFAADAYARIQRPRSGLHYLFRWRSEGGESDCAGIMPRNPPLW